VDRTPRIVVVGSFIMDLVVRAARRPARGETLIGTEFGMFPGGKGANQAVAAARLGASVCMIGCLGTDSFGDVFVALLEDEGINTRFVVRDQVEGTGVGNPVIDADGDNSIIIVPRANAKLTPADVDKAAEAIASADVLVLQLEVPMATSIRAAEIARESSTRVLLNPAPAAALPDSFLRLVDVIVPNEIEFEALTGIAPDSKDAVLQGSRAMFDRGVDAAVVTVGNRGAYVVECGHVEHYEAQPVSRVVDTTGAGDAFCGALATRIGLGCPLGEAVQFANRAAAIAVTRMGAVPSLPRIDELSEESVS
jgi:ribokinase